MLRENGRFDLSDQGVLPRTFQIKTEEFCLCPPTPAAQISNWRQSLKNRRRKGDFPGKGGPCFRLQNDWKRGWIVSQFNKGNGGWSTPGWAFWKRRSIHSTWIVKSCSARLHQTIPLISNKLKVKLRQRQTNKPMRGATATELRAK